MTEREWLESTDLKGMILALRGRVHPLQLRQFLVLCAERQVLARFGPGGPLAEQTTPEELQSWIAEPFLAERVRHLMGHLATHEPLLRDAFEQAAHLAVGVRQSIRRDRPLDDSAASLAHLLRCLFGNPFRPAAIDPAWLEWNQGTVPNLARTVRDDGRFDLMPILGDALEDAMCDRGDVLDHCRAPCMHVPDCWVLRSILD